MAPEGAILSLVLEIFEVRGWMSFKALSRPDGLLAATRPPAEALCDGDLVLLIADSMRPAGGGRELWVFGIVSFFAVPPLILPSP